MGKASRHINGIIIGDPIGTASDPIGEKEGHIYWNDTLLKFRRFDGTTWADFGNPVDLSGYATLLDNVFTGEQTINVSTVNEALVVNHTGSGWGIVSDSGLTGTGFNFVGLNNGSFTFGVDINGIITANQYNGTSFNGVALTTGGNATDFLNAQGNYVPTPGGGGGDVYLANTQTFTGQNTFSASSGVSQNVGLFLDMGGDLFSSIRFDQLNLFGYGVGTTVLTGNNAGFAFYNSETIGDGNIKVGIITASGAVTGTTFNGVALTTAGLATEYLDGSGNYSVPAGGGGDDVSTFAEKTGDLVGTDRLVGLSGATDFSETISGIPLSIFNNDANWTSSTGLEAINEGNGIGWRLIGRNPAEFGNIGLGAVDFGSYLTLPTQGATGAGSFNAGEDNINPGILSASFGELNVLSNNLQFVAGSSNTIGGYSSAGFGTSNIVQDHYSFTAGALNNSVERFNITLGVGLTTKDYGAVAVGRNNTDYTATGGLNGVYPIFIVGIGDLIAGTPVGLGTKRDGFIVSQDGEVNAPSLTNTIINAADDQVLTTKGWINAQGFGGVYVHPNHTGDATSVGDGVTTVVALRGVALDSTVSTPNDGDILVYRSIGSDWVLETKPTPGGGGATQLSELSDVTSAVQTAGFVLASSGADYAGRALIATDIPNLSLTKINDVTALASELNLLDLSGLTIGWVLSADSTTTASWKAPTGGGDVFKIGTPADNQVAVWTGDGTVEGTDSFTHSNGVISLGINATQLGKIQLLGAGIGSADGGYIEYNTSADHDTIIQGYRVGAFQDDFLFNKGLTAIMTYDGGAGLWRLDEYGGTQKTAGAAVWFLAVDSSGNIIEEAAPSGSGDDVSTFAEKTGALVGTDRLVGLSVATDFSETISGIPLSIFNNDAGWTSNVGNVTKVGTPLIGQVGVWTGDGTLEGTNDLRYSSGSLQVGQLDSVRGSFSLHGDSGANGGFMRFYNGGVVDTENDYFEFFTTGGGDFLMRGNLTGTFLSYDSGTTILSLSNASVNGVTLTTSGLATEYLNAQGNYTAPAGGSGDDVSTFAEKTGNLVGTDRLVGLSGATDFSETISGIPLSIFNNDLGWTSNVGDLSTTDINTFSKLDTIVADKSLVNLEDAQTFTGVNTFSANNIFNDTQRFNFGLGFLPDAVIRSYGIGGFFGYRGASVYAFSQNNDDLGSTDRHGLFDFSLLSGGASDQYTYSFPSLSGTVALTSNLTPYALLVSPSFTTPSLGVATATSINGVALTTGGVATQYLDGTGNYSTPTGGGISGSTTDNQISVGAATANTIESYPTFTFDVTTFTQEIGLNDTSNGSLWLYGNATTGGGSLRIYNGASNDTNYDYWKITTFGESLKIDANVGSAYLQLGSTGVLSSPSGQYSFSAENTTARVFDAGGNTALSITGDAGISAVQIQIGDIDVSGNGFIATIDQANTRLNLTTGAHFSINGVNVLNETTLGSGVVSSSLTSVGTITSGTWNSIFQIGGVTVTALASELNLLDLAGLTAGWVLSADSATTASWKAQSVNGQTVVVGDHGTASTDEVVNVCYGTSATPPSAGTVTEGALYIQYTA